MTSSIVFAFCLFLALQSDVVVAQTLTFRQFTLYGYPNTTEGWNACKQNSINYSGSIYYARNINEAVLFNLTGPTGFAHQEAYFSGWNFFYNCTPPLVSKGPLYPFDWRCQGQLMYLGWTCLSFEIANGTMPLGLTYITLPVGTPPPAAVSLIPTTSSSATYVFTGFLAIFLTVLTASCT